MPGLTWERAGESKATAGKTCLMRGNDVVLLVNMYCSSSYFRLDSCSFGVRLMRRPAILSQ